MPRAATRATRDTTADRNGADELVLYIENDGDLYRAQHIPIVKSMMLKRARGEYDPARAITAFGYLAESGAKKYAYEHGHPNMPWHAMFSPATRQLAAATLARRFETEAGLGNYDHLLPEKYQASTSPGPTTRGRRSTATTSRRKPTSELDREVDEYLSDSRRRDASAVALRPRSRSKR